MSKNPSNSLQNLITILALAAIVCLSHSTTIPPIPNFDLSSFLSNPTTGFTITGNKDVGKLVGTAGDVDDDGYDDIIVSIGEAISVLYGNSASLSSDMNLDPKKLDHATMGFAVKGNFGQPFSEERLADIARKAGDVNGDGYDDVIFATSIEFDSYSHGEGEDQEGRVYVIFGRERLSEDSTLQIPGFVIDGIPRKSNFKLSVNIVGDVNGDGYDDIIIGTGSYNNYQGIVYIIYGRQFSLEEELWDELPSDQNPEDDEYSFYHDLRPIHFKFDPKTDGFLIQGDGEFHQFGVSVSSAGDVNGDGYDDIIVGANSKNSEPEAAYVIYGGPKSSLQHINLGSTPLDPASTGFMIKANSVSNQNEFKTVVSTAGDVNGDGYDDLLIGTPYKNRFRGIAYVIYGGAKSSMQNIDLNSITLNPSTTGFMILGGNIDDQVGFSLSTAGDVNGDGFDDIIIGAPETNNSQGAVYVIYGGPKLSLQNIDLNSTVLDPFSTGFIIRGDAKNDHFGWSVSPTGDMNGEIIIGAPYKNKRQGAAYVIHAGRLLNGKDSYTRLESQKACQQGYYRSKSKCKRCPEHLTDCPSLKLCEKKEDLADDDDEEIINNYLLINY